jgi:hypothetical protein
MLENKKILKQYSKCLSMFWSGKNNLLINKISRILSNRNIESQERACLYRLWIEQLADARDYSSLTLLGKHIIKMLKLGERDSLLSLLALIHLEKDECESAKVVLSQVKDKTSPYYLESKNILSLRLGDDRDLHLFASNHDYFCLRHLARGFYLEHKQKEFTKVIRRIKSLFPESPLSLLDVSRLLQENKTTKSSLASCKKMSGSLPKDFDLYYAQTLVDNKKYRAACNYLEGSVKRHSLIKDYLLYSLAKSYFKLSNFNKESKSWKLAMKSWKKFSTKITHLELLRKYQEDQKKLFLPSGKKSLSVKLKSSKSKDYNYWVVTLSARRYFELMQNKNRNFWFDLGLQANVGDLVFFAKTGGSYTTIGAVYTVDSYNFGADSFSYPSFLQLLSFLPKSVVLEDMSFEYSKLYPDGIVRLSDSGLLEISDRIKSEESFAFSLRKVS